MPKDNFLMLKSWAKTISKLSDEDAGQLIKAIYSYQLAGELPAEGDLPYGADIAFSAVLPFFEAAEANYQATCERNKANGQNGGRPKKDDQNDRIDNPEGVLELVEPEMSTRFKRNPKETQKNPLGFSENQKKPTRFFEKPTETQTQKTETQKNPIEKEIEIDIEKEKEIYKEKEKGEEKAAPPPKRSEKEKETAQARAAPCPFSQILTLYNDICVSLPKIRDISGKRKIAVAARWHDNSDLDTFRQLFEAAEKSDFLKGKNNRKWVAGFDWLMTPTFFDRTLEGKYNDDYATSDSFGDADEFLAAAIAKGLKTG